MSLFDKKPLSREEVHSIREMMDKNTSTIIIRLLATLDEEQKRGPTVREREAIAMEIILAERDGADARDAGKPLHPRPGVNGVYDDAWERGWHWADACHERDAVRERVRALDHVTSIESILSPKGTGTVRRARCNVCNWWGPERTEMQLATEDALAHERKPF